MHWEMASVGPVFHFQPQDFTALKITILQLEYARQLKTMVQHGNVPVPKMIALISQQKLCQMLPSLN